jgi:hypothetical protein
MKVEEHFRETADLLRKIPADDAASWLLNTGYLPENYVLPPSFTVSNFQLQTTFYNRDLNNLTRRQLLNISYPKSLLSSRTFGIIHPYNYHDIVFCIKENWLEVIDHIFHNDIKIFSYSFPLPVSSREEGKFSKLRSGRMIYEWIDMAEKDLIIDSREFKIIARTDITNFYGSIYTHSIAWALHGREEALKDSNNKDLFGNKIDVLIQSSSDRRTNGIPVGSALSDLIAEIVLASVDKNISLDLEEKGINFLAVRFKDDYRILCSSKEDAEKILKTISRRLQEINLTLNENKTSIFDLPDGLYRKHDRAYFPYSLRQSETISFKTFEHTLLIALDIHRNYPGTSILEKFFSEIFDSNRKLKIKFSDLKKTREKEIKKSISLMFLVKRESEKILCHVLSIVEQLFLSYKKEFTDLKDFIKLTIVSEIKTASSRGSVFEIVWLVFFSRFISLGIKPEEFKLFIENELIISNQFYKTIFISRQEIFKDSHVNLFKKPSDCWEVKDFSLAKYLDIFDRNK